MAFAVQAQAGFFSWFAANLTSNAQAASEDSTVNSQTIPLLQAAQSASAESARGGGDITVVGGTALLSESGPLGTAADFNERSNGEISIYVVHKGDTISEIAKMFGVSVNTIMWGNDLKSTILREGQQLIILPISGVRHVVVQGDTIASIAKKYKGDVQEILQFNDIAENQALSPGQVIIVPDGEIAAPIAKPSSVVGNNPAHDTNGPDYGSYYGKPLLTYIKTQGLHGYNGVDLAAPKGTPIYAAAAGVVIIAKNSGWNGGYGNYVVITHNNGTQTLYSHATQVVVYEGMQVTKGQLIAYVGATGKATGPHLHFEVRGAKNPF